MGNFVSAVYGVLDSRNHIITFANCGHNLPVLLRHNDEVIYLAEGGVVLGVSLGATYQERPLFLNENDIILFYTDGVSEVFNSNGEEYGLDRLVAVLKTNRQKSSSEILSDIYREVTDFASTEHVFDDFTAIVLKRL
jgi:sigma-B regulation protein RsbU (phosphoserine phosphatase)